MHQLLTKRHGSNDWDFLQEIHICWYKNFPHLFKVAQILDFQYYNITLVSLKNVLSYSHYKSILLTFIETEAADILWKVIP